MHADVRPTAVVAGASSDIGGAVALALAELGYDLRLWGRDELRLDRAAEECRVRGAEVLIRTFDVTDRIALERACSADAGDTLRAVVWSNGVFDWAAADVADVSRWDDVLDVNLASAAAATRLLLPSLLAGAPSTIVFIGSLAGLRIFANNAAYVASKHGLDALAKAVFEDVRDRGVGVSVISPGVVAAGAGLESPAFERGEPILTPAHVARAVAFVLSSPPGMCPTQIVLEALPER